MLVSQIVLNLYVNIIMLFYEKLKKSYDVELRKHWLIQYGNYKKKQYRRLLSVTSKVYCLLVIQVAI